MMYVKIFWTLTKKKILIFLKIHEIIKNLIRNNYKEVEKKWSEIDEQNSSELTKDTLFLLLKKFN